MKWIPIDKKEWARAEAFDFYITKLVMTYDVNIELDITHFLKTVKDNGLTFYPAMCWAVTKVINNHIELRLSLAETHWIPFGSPEVLTTPLGYFETLSPTYTILHKDTETISFITTEWRDDLREYHDAQRADMEKYKDAKTIQPQKDIPLDIVNLSCLPWETYAAMSTTIYGGHTYLRPIITWGKYCEKEGKVTLPFTFHIHHAAADGWEVSRYLRELQELMDDIENYLPKN